MRTLRNMWIILRESFLHPFETTIIDRKTGKVIERKRRP
jgi:hypothetical protein